MQPGDEQPSVPAWRHAFTLLASLELGREPPWAGPDDVDELKLRVETLALLLALVPRNELGRLGEVVAHLATAYPAGSTPSLGTVRAGVRRLLKDLAGPTPGRDQYFRRAEAAVARELGVPRRAGDAPVAQSGDRPEDHDRCRSGMAAWFERLDMDPEWAYVGMAATDAADAPIDEVFVDVYAVPDADLEPDPDGGSERVRRATGRVTGETHAVIDAAAMVARTSAFCVVVGDPGSGKSTLVQWVARRVAAENNDPGAVADFEAAIAVKLGPFALALAGSPDLSLVGHFFAALGGGAGGGEGAAGWLRNAADEGARYLLLLDGWDEVPAALRDDVRRRIDRERPSFTIVVTSRPSGFPRRLATGRHAEVYHVAGLTRDGRRALAARYLHAAGREGLLPDLLRQVESSRDLQELACNPFMLALLTRAVAAGGVRPAAGWTLAELYRLAAGWVIDASDERDPDSRALLARSLDGLGRLSHGLLFGETLPRYVFAAEDLHRALGGAEAAAVEGSRFVTRVDPAGGRYAFLHATFEEYFAARHAESLGGRELDALLERAFLSASRGVVLEFVVGLPSDAGEACRAHLGRWTRHRDRYAQVVYRVARLLAACPAGRRPVALAAAIQSELWSRITGTRDLDVKELGVSLFARLDPVALCRAVRAGGKPDQYVLDCVTSAVPAAVGIAERIADLMDPAYRERVEAELWGGRGPGEIEANRQALADPAADEDRIREAVLFAGAARDQGAVAPLVARLRTSLPDELQQEIATSLGLIGGKEAGRALVDLVTGDTPASHTAAGLARRSLQHTEGGRRRLDPEGRDALLRRIACARIDRPREFLMLSALQGFPARAGTGLLKHLATAAGVENVARLECLQVLESSLPDAELDGLLKRIGAERGEIEAMLVAAAVQRRRPLPVGWLAGRLSTSARLPDKKMLLTVALTMSARPETASADVDGLLAEVARDALVSLELRHADLAGAFRDALADLPIDHGRPPAWVDALLCRQAVHGFLARDYDVPAERVMLAAALLGRVPERVSGELLSQCLTGCRERLTPPPAEMQAKLLLEVARAAARSLADLDPEALLAFPADWPPVDEVLHILSNRRGWLVFDDRILDAEGVRIRPPWHTHEETPDAAGGPTGAAGPADTVRRPMSDTDPTAELLVKVGNLKGLLASRATNGTPSEEEYAALRTELVRVGPVRDLLPKFVLSCRTVREFWNFIKPKFPTHRERLDYLQAEFDPVLTALEAGPGAAEATHPGGRPVLAANDRKPRPDVVVVTVNPHETRAVHDAFAVAAGTPAVPVVLDNRVYRNLGVVNGTAVFHALSEMGSGSVGAMQQTVDLAIRALDPGAVVAVGIAFGVNEKKQKLGDILLSKQLRPYDLQRVGADILLRDDKPHASARLINHFGGFAQTSWRGVPVRPGVILTGNRLVDDIDYRDQLVALEGEAVGGEMEGAGLYVSCQEHKVDWVVIKAICDWADGHKATNKSARQKKAAENAARFLVEALQYAPLTARK